MKKFLVLGLGAVLVLSSCGTSAGTGAYVGGQFGHVIGSAVGGIGGGWRGHHVGSVVGTVGGAVAGAAIGAAVDNAQQQRMNEQRTTARVNQRQSQQRDDSGFDAQGRGDDRITFDDAPAELHYNIASAHPVEPTQANARTMGGFQLHQNPAIEIRRARVVDIDENGVLTRGEECKVSFEIMNNSDKPIFNVQPTVVEMTGNKHVHISPNLNVESIPPRQGVRYTATILADGRLKDGEVRLRIAVAQDGRTITSQIQELIVPTRGKRR